MPEKMISSLFHPSSRFIRSVQIERDFVDSDALKGYVLTDHSKESLSRIALGLRSNSTQRAWRITGNYGAGKSIFTLLLARWFAGEARCFPSSFKSSIGYKKLTPIVPRLMPILVTGSRDSMAHSIFTAVGRSLEHCYDGRKKPKTIKELIHNAQLNDYPVSDQKIINTLKEVNDRVIHDGLSSGLFLVMDELGKFLEHATLHPEQQDIYLLQNLAEMASRSGDKPIFVVGLLHQGFHAYAHSLSDIVQREWEKIAARFEEIVFDQPLDELTTLIASALNVNIKVLSPDVKKEAKCVMEKTIEMGWFGVSRRKSALLENSEKIYPLHPTILPVLAHVFRRFGQNERSLFSFLFSNEPFGLQSFSARPLKGSGFYKLHDLYDYIRFNFGHYLARQSYRSHWNLIDSMIQSYVTENPLETNILKTIGILNLLDSNDLVSREKEIYLSLSETRGLESQKVKTCLKDLHTKKHILHYRGTAGGYCLWPYTSVNLEVAYEKASKIVPQSPRVSDKVSKYIDSTPIVARRHYIMTGNLRYFDVSYSVVSSPASVFEHKNLEADGFIVMPLCETEQERRQALKIASSNEAKKHDDVIICISPPLNNLSGLMGEAERWQWVSSNTPELVNDRYASEEVTRQTRAATTALDKRLQSFLGLYQFSVETSLDCYYKGKKLKVSSNRDLLQHLSCICDKIYPDAPQIKNELVNRQFLSSAAAGARMRLIERMLACPNEELLGMDKSKKPPEMSMYLSVMQATNIHRKAGSGWRIAKPTRNMDISNIVPAWECIESMLKNKPDQKNKVIDIFEALQRTPYGVRDGLIPIFFAAFIIASQDQLALYEKGSFLPTVEKEEFLRLIKFPQSFEVQLYNTAGVRTELLRKLQIVVTDTKPRAAKPAILELVRPICVFVARLPDYAQATKKLSISTVAVRQAVLSAKDPVALLFKDLPKACGCPAFKMTKDKSSNKKSNEFIRLLKHAFAELRMAYPQLIDRIIAQVQITFNLSSEVNPSRSELAERAKKMLVHITEPKLKAFCIRLSDEKFSDLEWGESVGSFLVSSPPSKWCDNDEDTFIHELSLLSSQFSRVERLLLDKQSSALTSADMRVALTRSDGSECGHVVYCNKNEKKRIAELEEEVKQIIAENKRIGIAAVLQALWHNLSEGKHG